MRSLHRPSLVLGALVLLALAPGVACGSGATGPLFEPDAGTTPRPDGARVDAGPGAPTPDATVPDAAPADDAGLTGDAALDAGPARGAALVRFVEAEMARHHREGVTVAAVKNGREVYHAALGRADLAKGVPMRDDTVFLVASMSKPVTAVAVLQAAEDLARARGTTVAALLDADVNDLARTGPSDMLSVRHPGHPDVPITLRMLLAHVSGISVNYEKVPHHLDVAPPTFAAPPELPTLHEAHAEYLRPGGRYFSWDNFVDASPGEAYEYSSIASAIPAHFVERATGVTFAEHCRRRIFEPLGMADTAWRIADLPQVVAKPDRLALPYLFDEAADASVPVAPSVYWENVFYPSASLRSTAVDYAKLVGALMDEASGLASPESLRELRRVQYPALDSTQGLILYYMKRGGMWVLGHEGYNDGFLTSAVFMVRTEKLADGGTPTDLWGAVVLTNGEWDAPTGDGFLRAVGGEVLRAGLAGELD